MVNSPYQSYLFVIDSSEKSLAKAIDIIDDIAEVVNWSKILPDAAVLVSDKDVTELHKILKSRMPRQRYILTLLERGKKQGWLAKDAWTFINEPKPAG